MASKWSAGGSALDDNSSDDLPSSKGSLELEEWLLEGQPSSDRDGQPARPRAPASTAFPTSFCRHWKRRHSVEQRWARLKAWLHWTPCNILIRIVKFLLVFAFGSLSTLLIYSNLDQLGADDFDLAWRPLDFTTGAKYPVEYFRRVLPVPVHSHNDYWRRRPLYSALLTGCISVEADVWLVDKKLYVGHSAGELDVNSTLASLYVDPLVAILEQINKPNAFTKALHKSKTLQPKGVFYQEPKQTLNLLIDFKTDGYELFPFVMEALEPLRSRGWLTHWDGRTRLTRPITVVGTGNTPFDSVVANTTYRDIFFDAPLEALESGEDPSSTEAFSEDDASLSVEQRVPHMYKYNPANSHFASSSMQRALGPIWNFRLSDSQIKLMRRQIRQARDRGLLPRYWGTPRWPRRLRNEVWTVLVKEHVGLLNVDDLRAVRRGLWGSWPQPRG